MRVDVLTPAVQPAPAVFVPSVPSAPSPKPERGTAAAARNDAIVHSMLAGLKANLGVLKSLVTATEAQLQALQGLLGGQMPSPGADIDAFLQDLGVVEEVGAGFPATEDLVTIARRCVSASEAGAGEGTSAPEGKPTAPVVTTCPIIIKDKAPAAPVAAGKDKAPKTTPSLKRVPSPEDGLETFLKVGRQTKDDDFSLACARGHSSWDLAWGSGSSSSTRSQFP
jgi:hypothetical protein